MATATKQMSVTAGNSTATVQATVNDNMPGIACPNPAGYRYVGARYVPKFAEPIDWNNATTYEPLTIVTYQGNSYTSKQFVPTGVEITNTDYWAPTGNYNAQVEQYRQEVLKYAAMASNAVIELDESDLESIELDDGITVLYKGGYYTVGTATANGFNIIQMGEKTLTFVSGHIALTADYTLESQLALTDAVIDLGGYKITSELDKMMISLDRCVIENGSIENTLYTASSQNQDCLTVRDTVISNVSISGNTCVRLQSNSAYTKIVNCTLAGKYIDVFGNNISECNGVEIIDCDFSFDQTSYNLYNGHPKINVFNGVAEAGLITDEVIANKSNGFTVKGCKFGYCTQREIYILNYRDVVVENCTFTNKELDSDKGGCGDVISFDLCENVLNLNLEFTGGGENGIDILSCKNTYIAGCKFNELSFNAICVDISDAIKYQTNVALNNLYCEDTVIEGCVGKARSFEDSSDYPTMINVLCSKRLKASNCVFISPYKVGSMVTKNVVLSSETLDGATSTMGDIQIHNCEHIITNLDEAPTTYQDWSISCTFDDDVIISIDEKSGPIYVKSVSNANTTQNAPHNLTFPSNISGVSRAYKAFGGKNLRPVNNVVRYSDGKVGGAYDAGFTYNQYFIITADYTDNVAIPSMTTNLPLLNYKYQETEDTYIVKIFTEV